MDEKDNYLAADNRIKKEIIKKGRHGKKPNTGWTCQVKLEAKIPPDIDVNSDYIQNYITSITIDEGNWFVDRMIESCLRTMLLEEQSKFVIPLTKAEYLNNDKSIEVRICLEAWNEKPNIFEWSEEEKISAANNYKKAGVELFKQNRIRHAFNKFSQALKLILLTDTVLEPEAKPNAEVNSLLTALYNNLAGCQLHHKNYKHTLELCNKSLDISPTSKAYYRRALAYIEFKLYEKAENDLIELLKIEPKNKIALEKIHLVRELDKKNRENYKGIVKKMFS